MNNITFDARSFSDQLGIYDFFNVLVSGGVFLFGLCAINNNILHSLWGNMTVQKGLGIVFLTYLLGLVLQEVSAQLDRLADKKGWTTYKRMNRSILVNPKRETEPVNDIIDNPLVLKHYRRRADVLLGDLAKEEDRFEKPDVNGFVFSACQYYVSVCGKDRKVEKMRAIFSMSRALALCFFLLALFVGVEIFMDVDLSVQICGLLSFQEGGAVVVLDKVILCTMFSLLSAMFRSRARKNMKHFLLILLGTYDAILRIEEEKQRKSQPDFSDVTGIRVESAHNKE